MAHARLGDDEVARAELEAMRAYLGGKNAGGEGRPPILREVEALVEPSSTGDPG